MKLRGSCLDIIQSTWTTLKHSDQPIKRFSNIIEKNNNEIDIKKPTDSTSYLTQI
jgi:hypothetical protein